MRRFTIRNFVAFITREDRASILPTFAIALVPLVGAVGASVDYSQANQVRSSLQSTLDAAILAAVRDGTSGWNSTAKDFFNANLQLQGVSVQSPSFTKSDTGMVSGSVSAVVPTNFLGVLGISSVPVTANSSAALADSATAQYCVLALNKSAQPGLRLTGNATIDIKAPDCILQVNSGATGAVNMNGNASITSARNCFVGSIVKVGNATVTPPPTPECPPAQDPFVNYSGKPPVGPCTFTNYSLSGNTTVALNPGTYCGGMQFSGQVNVTFNPGIYVIKDGPLKASSGASFTGNGVAFYLTGAGAAVNLSGQASVRLVAPTAGHLAGFIFFLEPSGPTGLAAASSDLSGSSELYFEGVIYLPGQLVNITGSAEVGSPSPYTSFIADRIDINGNGTLAINNDPTKTTVPVPKELKVSLGGQPRLLQ
jgi:Flp pilus assembly protein TadG